MKKTIITLLVGAILASAPLAAVAGGPSTPGKKPDAMEQHRAEDQTRTKPAAKEKAKKKKAHKARVGTRAQKNSASSQLGRDKNLH